MEVILTLDEETKIRSFDSIGDCICYFIGNKEVLANLLTAGYTIQLKGKCRVWT